MAESPVPGVCILFTPVGMDSRHIDHSANDAEGIIRSHERNASVRFPSDFDRSALLGIPSGYAEALNIEELHFKYRVIWLTPSRRASISVLASRELLLPHLLARQFRKEPGLIPDFL